MYRRVIAFDFDGTLAENDHVPVDVQRVLEQLIEHGYTLFLVTGRLYEAVALGELAPFFAGIVWENGAVLSQRQSGQLYLPFGHIDPQVVRGFEQAGVPLERGLAIVSTWSPHEQTVADVISNSGSDAVIAHNKGAIMVLPPGTAKGPGLERMLELCDLSPHSVISFGDGENDLSLLQASEGRVAVANAVQGLQSIADLVTTQPGSRGVIEALQTYWLTDRLREFPARNGRMIPLGHDEQGRPVSLPSSRLASYNLGIYGDSGTGKSWVTGLLVEGMHREGYQVLLIDPEGDHRGLCSLPRMMAIDGDDAALPNPAVTALMLEEASSSVVLDLSGYPHSRRQSYVAELIQRLLPLRRHKYRPHWIVLEEAQEYLPREGGAVLTALLPLLGEGGWSFVTYRPDLLAVGVRQSLQTCLITRLRNADVLETSIDLPPLPSSKELATTRVGSVWLCGERLVRLHAAGRRVPHIRHFYKYLDTPLPKHKRFYFRTESGYLGIEAASLFDFKELLPTLPAASLDYHQTRGDFAKWIRGALGDDLLAGHIEKLAHRNLTGEVLRDALYDRVSERYADLYEV